MSQPSPVRLLIVITGLHVGGAEIFLRRLVENFSSAVSPVVVSLSDLGENGALLRAAGVRVEAVGGRRSFSLGGAFRLYRLIREVQPDIVFTWLYHGCLIGSLIARLAGVRRIVWNVRNTAIPSGAASWHARLAAWLCLPLSRFLPVAIVCCSRRAATAHVAMGYPAERMRVVHNGFDTGLFQPQAAVRALLGHELGIDPAAPLIGRIARDDPQKDTPGFLQCCALLARRFPAARFLLVGAGMDAANQSLTEALQQLGLHSRVLLLGLRDDVPRIMAGLDVLVSSSIAEAFPNVIAEAMACGTPCVVTDVGDSADIVGSCGTVVAPGDPAALASACAELLAQTPERRRELGQRARLRIVSEFGLAVAVDRYEQLLLACAARHD